MLVNLLVVFVNNQAAVRGSRLGCEAAPSGSFSMFANRGGGHLVPIELYRDGFDSPWGIRFTVVNFCKLVTSGLNIFRSDPIPRKVTFIEKHFGHIHQNFVYNGR